jgi:hypothetical protein
MPIPKNDRQEEYTRYAEHYLAMAKIAPGRQSRVIQREMAAGWLTLAEAAPSQDKGFRPPQLAA